MKWAQIVLLISLLSFASAQCVEKPEIPLLTLGLKQPQNVKRVYDYQTNRIDKEGGSFPSGEAESWTLQNGKVTSYVAYAMSPHEEFMVFKYVYKNGRMISSESHFAGEHSFNAYLYDATGRPVRMNSFDLNPKGKKEQDFYSVCTYSGNTITETSHELNKNKKWQVSSRAVYTYQGDRLVKKVHYLDHGKTSGSTSTTTYQYDAKGRQIKESKAFSSSKDQRIETFLYDTQGLRSYYDFVRVEYQMDERGNWISRTTHLKDGGKVVESRKIEYLK
ncbi:hypothetical protein [Deinococcus cellulosilyticus]|uniref:YD repeat-containing protein n=1 Tax=Deinococcus cellulosilyticus (strain DSM 18568 / NBRC 106333 / KACC 11606 / 5516J-15) TaxID=1223518 RepID=A0A511N8X3_DEIC1|nr:hypothetical protein [Deinococcus cellulosilyticus]GEM49280.1 hypothetical protein DC3_49150 [Deinococcus cellulosilyticus NBRC 106333 = KACC 11606]